MSQPPTFEIESEISKLEDAIGKLSPVQKMLLGTDGSVTRLLEVITGSPVEIETLNQEIFPANEVIARDLEVDVGDLVNYRVVKLKNSTTGETLIHAVSHTPLKRLEPRFKEDLMRADVPIGIILKKHNIESRRELTNANIIRDAAELHKVFNVFSKEPLLSRGYKIIRGGFPLMSITETFPYNNFQDHHRVIVETPCRIHMTLTDLAGNCGRVDGGVGLALDEPNLVVEAERNDDLEICGKNVDRAIDAAKAIIDNFELGGAKINIRSCYPLHVGLGGGTQLAIAVGKALCGLYRHEVTVREIASIVNRGGTSGVGVAAFEGGGFIVDGGHSFGPGKAKVDFRPSSASKNVIPPPVIMRHDFPSSWKVLLAVPNLPKGAYGKREVDIFGEFCPLPQREVQELCQQIMMRMMPSVMEEDLDSFGLAINRIQELGFKKVEIELQHPLVRQLMEVMRNAGASGVGLSSFGPTVYAFTDGKTAFIETAAMDVMDEVGGQMLVTKSRNIGARMRMA